MIQLSANTTILLATQPADFRNGIDGFAAMCRPLLQQNPQSGTVFVFINKRKTMIRALHYDGNGFWLMTKRLSKGRFQYWPRSTTDMSAMQAKELRQLLMNAEKIKSLRI